MAQRFGLSKKAVSKKIIASVITLAVIALLVFAGPASAINLGLQAFSNSNPEKGEVVSTTATITVSSNERMALSNGASVLIDGSAVCGFALNQDFANCSSSGVTVELISTSDSNGYGYSYDYGYGYGYNYGYANGYGYGYGYQQGYSNSKFTYNITVDTSKYSYGSHSVKLFVDAGASHQYSSGEQTISVGVSDGQQYAEDETVIVGNDTSEIVFDSGSSNVSKIVIPSSIPSNQSVMLNLASLLVGNTVTLPNEITLMRETSAGNYTATIPAGTVITGDSGWDGKITLPTVTTLSTSLGSVSTAVEIGSSLGLTFSNAVQVVLGGMTGKKALWANSTGSFAISLCSDANSTSSGSLTSGECYVDDGKDLIVWTYHFTTFGAYTPASTTTSVAATGGSGGNSYAPKKIVNATTTTIPGSETQENVAQTNQPGFLARITGAVIGALGTTGATIAVIFILVVIVAVVIVSRRKPAKTKKGKKGKKDSDDED